MVIIMSKSAAVVLQVSENTARIKLRELRKKYGLLPHQKVCITKFCEYFALNEERVIKKLREFGH